MLGTNKLRVKNLAVIFDNAGNLTVQCDNYAYAFEGTDNDIQRAVDDFLEFLKGDEVEAAIIGQYDDDTIEYDADIEQTWRDVDEIISIANQALSDNNPTQYIEAKISGYTERQFFKKLLTVTN